MRLFIGLCFFSILSVPLFPNQEKKVRKAVISQAKKWVGKKLPVLKTKNRSFRADCSGYVRACYFASGYPLDRFLKKKAPSKNIALALYRNFSKNVWKDPKKIPEKGDLVFFNNTYDRNKNRKWDDWITHVGLVEKVYPQGTIAILHYTHRGVRRYHMNLRKPRIHKINGRILNHYLRRRPAADPDRGKYTTGSLFAAFASVL